MVIADFLKTLAAADSLNFTAIFLAGLDCNAFVIPFGTKIKAAFIATSLETPSQSSSIADDESVIAISAALTTAETVFATVVNAETDAASAGVPTPALAIVAAAVATTNSDTLVIRMALSIVSLCSL